MNFKFAESAAKVQGILLKVYETSEIDPWKQGRGQEGLEAQGAQPPAGAAPGSCTPAGAGRG